MKLSQTIPSEKMKLLIPAFHEPKGAGQGKSGLNLLNCTWKNFRGLVPETGKVLYDPSLTLIPGEGLSYPPEADKECVESSAVTWTRAL